jgi:hypothetical protein
MLGPATRERNAMTTLSRIEAIAIAAFGAVPAASLAVVPATTTPRGE